MPYESASGGTIDENEIAWLSCFWLEPRHSLHRVSLVWCWTWVLELTPAYGYAAPVLRRLTLRPLRFMALAVIGVRRYYGPRWVAPRYYGPRYYGRRGYWRR